MGNSLKIWLPRLAVAAAAAYLLLALGATTWLLAQHHRAAIGFPYPLDYGEGPLLDQALRLARFENIYRADLDAPPYVVANYPPLFPLVQAPFAAIFGPAFWYGRAISALGILATALFIGLTTHALTRDWLAGLASGLLLLAFPYVLHWSPLDRVDSLALGLSMAALFAIARWPERRAGLVACALLLTAAIYTRQSYGLAAPLAAFVWLLRAPPRRRALELAGLVAALGLALLAALQLATGGGFFFNIVTANVNPFGWGEVARRAEEMAEHMAPLLAGAALFFGAAVWLRVRSWWLVAPYLLGAALSAATIGKAGSNVNYLFELMAALSLAAGALLGWAGGRWWLRAPLLLLLAFQVNALADWSREDYYDRIVGRVARQAEIARLAEVVGAAEGAVLADEFMGLVPLAGKPLVFQPFELKQLARAGVWDETAFVSAIERQEFPVILLYQPPDWDSRGERWTERQLLYIALRYQPTETHADTVVYRPLR